MTRRCMCSGPLHDSACYEKLEQENERLQEENARLRKAVRNQAGDGLCWVDDPACQNVQALPEAEFLESCRRYHAQISERLGVARDLLTIAQLEAEIQRLRDILASARPLGS